jgi:hypothetical protein
VFNKNFTFRVSSHVSLREREEVMQSSFIGACYDAADDDGVGIRVVMVVVVNG